MDLQGTIDECADQARRSGFWGEYEELCDFLRDNDGERYIPLLEKLMIGQKLMLIVSEVSEALEEVRESRLPQVTHYRHDGKPEGFGIELADACIRIFDTSKYLGVELEEAIKEKMEFNSTRPHKHGKQF